MNAIANQVIRNSGRSGRNAGWPYFDGTFRDYPAFKRKFESFQTTYHRGTPTRELFQQFREMCLPEAIHQDQVREHHGERLDQVGCLVWR
jgi:hypothetical protein